MIFNKQPSPESAETPAQDDAAEVPQNPGETPAATVELSGAAEWEKKHNDLYDQYVRLQADFENYRKRATDEKESALKYGAQKAILELLPVLDNLDRATGSLNESSEAKVLYQSFSLMQKQLANGLEKMGVKKIDAAGQVFDPQFHEAISQLESTEHPENTVMYEAQAGYTLGDKVIRPAMVAVSSGPGPEGAEPAKAEAAASAPQAVADADNPFKA